MTYIFSSSSYFSQPSSLSFYSSFSTTFPLLLTPLFSYLLVVFFILLLLFLVHILLRTTPHPRHSPHFVIRLACLTFVPVPTLVLSSPLHFHPPTSLYSSFFQSPYPLLHLVPPSPPPHPPSLSFSFSSSATCHPFFSSE